MQIIMVNQNAYVLIPRLSSSREIFPLQIRYNAEGFHKRYLLVYEQSLEFLVDFFFFGKSLLHYGFHSI